MTWAECLVVFASAAVLFFLPDLAANQLPTDPVQLGPLIANLQIVEMAAQSVTVTLP